MTRHWLERLAHHAGGAFAHQVSPPFHPLYAARVLGCRETPLHRIAPKARGWRGWCRARAHTHFDLGEALLRAEAPAGVTLTQVPRAGPVTPGLVPVLHHWRLSGDHRAKAVLSGGRDRV
ncbi:MAG: hypothetical protein H6900_12600 [Rhodobacter sp.]|uniref:hypothetical protein n=1 Tax=Pararhodobacter sp. TaxID=2127056 RepID=UPI001D482E9C|nr:hypothetical protein [Pararhodobacter sp.]MCB1343729.1 hypothetical protein [Paracoccaceae bacterium]MCC0074118.1 hypothetical protein [Rhodobacter sp.]HPD92354.1 hypothetical protein [Pararhodobacter sp.]